MNTNWFFRKIFAAILLIGVSACGSDSSISSAVELPGNLILTVKQAGGCTRIGPNCAVHALFSDGKVTAARNTTNSDEENPPTEVTAAIDVGLAESWLMAVASEDFETLRQSLPAGQCASCADGIDLLYSINNGAETITFNSLDHAFDTSQTFFAITADLYGAMQDAAPLEILNR